MWPFTPKVKTNQELTHQCQRMHHELLRYATMAHTRSYYLFKQEMFVGFRILEQHICNETDPVKQKVLLERLHTQLSFLEKYPFSAPHDLWQNFYHEHFPYEEQLQLFLSSHQEHDGPSL